jgi:hypothetical protein
MGGPRKRWVVSVSHLCISASSSCWFPPPSRRYGVVPFLHLVVLGWVAPFSSSLPLWCCTPPRRCGVGVGHAPPPPRRVVLCCIPHRHVGLSHSSSLSWPCWVTLVQPMGCRCRCWDVDFCCCPKCVVYGPYVSSTGVVCRCWTLCVVDAWCVLSIGCGEGVWALRWV